MTAQDRELRLALAMRGGVSLAVWIGGACGEIDELRRGDADFWRDLTRACGFDRVVVDVLAGASAGGLNGVLFAAAIRHDFRMVDLLPVWVKLASVGNIARRRGPWISLFDGDENFLGALHTELSRLVGPGRDAPPEAGFIDLQLTATLVEPLLVPTVSLPDEQLYTKRTSAAFRFRHEGTGVAPARNLEGDDASLWRLALAARATSSFPLAFEPALVRSRRPERFGEACPSEPGPLVDCRGVFSETNGSAGADESADFVVADGGILDNIPIARAVDAIAAAPASGPTKRVLVYLHPTGPAAPPPTRHLLDKRPSERQAAAHGPTRRGGRATPPADISRRGVWPMVRALKTTKIDSETIDGDLAQLAELNDGVRRTRLLRRTALGRERRAARAADLAQFLLVWETYCNQRAASEADLVLALLADPIAMLGSDPFPDTGNQNRWRAPLSNLTEEERARFATDLLVALEARIRHLAEPGGSNAISAALFGTGTTGLERVLDLALEWVRALPPQDCTATAKEALYRLRSVVTLLRRYQRLAWVIAASRSALHDDNRLRSAEQALTAVEELALVLPALAEALVVRGDAGPFTAHGDRYLQRLLDALDDQGGSYDHPPEHKDIKVTAVPTPALVDLRELITGTLVATVGTLCGHLAQPVASGARRGEGQQALLTEDHPAALLHEFLADHDRDANRAARKVGEPGETAEQPGPPIEDRLIALEIEGLGEQLAGCLNGEETELRRISAAARCPLAAEFEQLQRRSRELDRKRGGGWESNSGFLRPEVKLAGNDLANFSAFLDRRWRRNDWMWGRLDAASDLITLLLDSATGPDGKLPPAVRELVGGSEDLRPDEIRDALIIRRQREILAELLVRPDALADYAVGLESPTAHGGCEVTGNVFLTIRNAARVIRRALPLPLAVLVTPLGVLAEIIGFLVTLPRRRRGPDPFKPEVQDHSGPSSLS